MAILVLTTSAFVEQQLVALRAQAPDETFYTDPLTAPAGDVEALLAFKLAPGIAPRFPGLRFVASAGAGADELLAAEDLSPAIAIVRALDPLQAQRMAQYVALMVLRHCRDLGRLEAQHAEARWKRYAPLPEAAYAIGVMGAGATAAPTIDVLQRLGFAVAIWTRTRRASATVETYYGAEGCKPFLARTHVLVCALPLTGETRGVLNAQAFAALPSGAYVINVSRGAVMREPDLLAAVESGHLAGAAVDVFEMEPLPAASPLWRHPKILCTPHIAAVPRAEVVAAQFLDNLRRARAGLPLVNVVDRRRGY